jgi:serine/threonine-protein kinase HipA
LTGLAVWWSGRVVGQLRAGREGGLVFRYPASATAQDRISASLPVDPSQDQQGTFFSNLLPDGEQRDRLAARLGVSPDNAFAMLAAVGGDCAGALSLLPVGAKPPASGGRRPLTSATLKQAREQGSAALFAGEGLRLSLAGAQDKLPVILDGRSLFLPEGATPSTHILKLPTERFRGLCENELLTRFLAERAGIPCAEARLWPLPDKAGNALLVTRFDRTAGRRVHQEDLCQALGLPPSKKYEADGGPTLADVIRLLSSESTAPAADIERAVRWQVFNVLSGNADGHAKNLALLRHAGRVSLAPAYDLVCTRQWGSLSRRLAFSIGGASDPGAIGSRHWRRAAEEWEVSPGFLLEIVRETGAALKAALAGLPDRAMELRVLRGTAQVVGEIVRKLVRRSESLLRGKG